MRKRFWFLCISFWLTSTLLPFETGADIEPPTWGEAIQNNSFLNIQVEGSSITVRQRVEMKLKKLLNDDYLYTFGTVSRNGQFNENSLSIFTPASGLKDSIFDHGCRLEYLSQVALEETLEIAFGYEYRYPHQGVGEIVYWRSKGTYQYAEIIDNIECVDITCNQVIEVKERMYSRSKWSTVGKGIHVVYHPSRSQRTSILKIVISTAEKVDTLVEQTLFEVTPEHREHVPNLIKNEFITIEFKDALNGTYDYHLSGTI